MPCKDLRVDIYFFLNEKEQKNKDNGKASYGVKQLPWDCSA